MYKQSKMYKPGQCLCMLCSKWSFLFLSSTVPKTNTASFVFHVNFGCCAKQLLTMQSNKRQDQGVVLV